MDNRNNLNNILNSINPEVLKKAVSQMDGILPPNRLKQVEDAIKSDKNLTQKLSGINTSDLKNMVKNNEHLKEQLSKNPEIMKNINSLLNNL